MYGHQRNLIVAIRILVVHIGHQHNIREPLLDRRAIKLLTLSGSNLRLGALGVLLHSVEQLLDIADSRLRLGGILSAVRGEQPRTGCNLHTEVVDALRLALECHSTDKRHKVGNLLYNSLLYAVGRGLLHKCIYRLPHRAAL